VKRIAIAFAGLLALAACSRGAGSSDQAAILHVGSQRGGTKAVMLASGALAGAPYTIEWSEFPAAQHLLEAIGAGAVDVGLVGDAPFMFAYQSGSHIRAIGAQFVASRPAGALALVVPEGSTARTLADLKGKKIATTRGSVGHYLVIRALAAAKLPPDWVRFTFLAPGDTKAAFSSGAIDGWATWTPYLPMALKDHARVIVDGQTLVRGYGFDVSNDAAIKARPALLADFLKREAKALSWARANPGAYAKVLARETGLPIDIAQDYAEKNGRTQVPIDDTVIADQRQVLDDFRAAGAIKGDRDLAGGFDRTLSTIKVAAAR
jgi:sulfonate transport system substrate-binding protein